MNAGWGFMDWRKAQGRSGLGSDDPDASRAARGAFAPTLCELGAADFPLNRIDPDWIRWLGAALLAAGAGMFLGHYLIRMGQSHAFGGTPAIRSTRRFRGVQPPAPSYVCRRHAAHRLHVGLEQLDSGAGGVVRDPLVFRSCSRFEHGQSLEPRTMDVSSLICGRSACNVSSNAIASCISCLA